MVFRNMNSLPFSPTHRLYEVLIPHDYSDWFEHALVSEPYFAGARLSQDCNECSPEGIPIESHDHFLLLMCEEYDNPTMPPSIVEIDCLIKLRVFFEDRPPCFAIRFVTWETYLYEATHPSESGRLLGTERKAIVDYLTNTPSLITWWELTSTEEIFNSFAIMALQRLLLGYCKLM